MAKVFFDKFKPKIRDVFDSIHPLHVFCRVFGLTNFKIVAFFERRRYKVASIVLTRQIVQTLVIAILTYAGFRSELDVNFFKQRFSSTVLDIEEVIEVILSTTGTAIGIVFAEKITSIVNRFDGIDFGFSKLKIFVVDWCVCLDEGCRVGATVTSSLENYLQQYHCTNSNPFRNTAFTSNLAFIKITYDVTSFYVMLRSLSSVMPQVVNLIVQCQYSNSALVIKTR
ncbi:hypothetical protein Trydic_g6450 [Trypoxylus dichotomus]